MGRPSVRIMCTMKSAVVARLPGARMGVHAHEPCGAVQARHAATLAAVAVCRRVVGSHGRRWGSAWGLEWRVATAA